MSANHEERDLTDTVICVTGAGSGIGAATALAALAAGARVIASDLHPEKLAAMAAAHPDQVEAVGSDASQPASADELLQTGISRWGRIDSVVANAGVGWFGGVIDLSDDQVRAMTETNFLGSVWLARAAIRVFRKQGDGGDVVIVGSVAGLGAGGGDEAVYAATKAAQMQFGTSLDREVRAEGVRVSVIAPAAVNTPFAIATGRFGDTPVEDGGFLRPADVAHGIITALRQPRRIRTAMWTMWSLAEANG